MSAMIERTVWTRPITIRIGNARLLRPTLLTRAAVRAMALIIFASAAFLFSQYASLPWLLPVHFKPNGLPNGWQYRTPARVLLPVFVQVMLAVTLGAISLVMLWRSHGDDDCETDDARAAAAATEAITLIGLIWVAFQAYAAIALVAMWTSGHAGLGLPYVYFELTGVVLSAVVAVRAYARLTCPTPRPYVAEHWRYGRLYRNAADPSLFVPTRDGRRWTLNFGRPVAAALLGLILLMGMVGPTLILAVFLRGQ
jgi:uncharacterized membrane protein